MSGCLGPLITMPILFHLACIPSQLLLLLLLLVPSHHHGRRSTRRPGSGRFPCRTRAQVGLPYFGILPFRTPSFHQHRHTSTSRLTRLRCSSSSRRVGRKRALAQATGRGREVEGHRADAREVGRWRADVAFYGLEGEVLELTLIDMSNIWW